MKISLNSIRYICDYYKTARDIIPDDIDWLVNKIGAQLGAVEEVSHTGEKYKGVVIAKVVSCADHPNADKLHVCKVDDGGVTKDVERDKDGYVQVVCGAPNVREGLFVAWLPPGTTVPSSYDDDPFVLEARDLRGEKSNGMLASLKELAIGDSHEGIAEIDEDFKPGTLFAKAYNLENDVVIDIENKMFTHRPDCFGFLGVARELAGIQHKAFASPDWYNSRIEIPAAPKVTLPLKIKNELPDLVPRFMAVAMSDVQVKPSPLWLQIELAKVGQRSINNIVDYTNYFMLVTGQPLHAYDYDKVRALDPGADAATIGARYPKKGEKLTLLNGKEIEPRKEAIIISTATTSIGLGGVMGGADTEVTDATTNIIVECATFNMYSIRRTSMAHGLFTDAVTRFNKGQSPLQNKAVLAKIVDEIVKDAGGKIASELIDDNHLDEETVARQSLHAPIGVPASFITARLGRTMEADSMARLLRHVEFGVQTQEDHLVVKAPFWRTDIEIPEDIVEEVGRLYGFDRVPLELPKRTITPVQKDELLELKANTRSQLSRMGANEVLTYSFVHGNLLEKVGQDTAQAYAIGNALSPDLQYYRMSLLPSLLDKVHANIKAGYDQFALFELGKSHVTSEFQHDEPDVPAEVNACALVFAANGRAAGNYAGAPYYQALTYLERALYGGLLSGAAGVYLQPLSEVDLYDNPWLVQMTALFDPGRSAVLKEIDSQLIWGVVGEFRASVRKALKLPAFSAGFEFDPLLIMRKLPSQYTPISKYPKVTQDMTLKVPATLSYKQLEDFINAEIVKAQPKKSMVYGYPTAIFQKPDDVAHKQVTLRLVVTNYEKTMTDTEVNKLLDTVASSAAEKLKSERV